MLFYEQYLEAQVSDNFAEIVKLYGERVTQAADEIMKETEKVASEIGMNDEITAKDCKPISHDDAIEDKVIVIRGNVLRPEFRHASHQLMLCTGGFGAQKNARGRTCYCISLYSGKQTSFYRGDVLGVMDKRSLPEWAKIGLQNALEIRQNEKSHPNERGCVNGVNWFKDRGQWADNDIEPAPGMIIFFDWDNKGSSGPQDGESDHTGIVERVEDGIVYTVEGNSGDSCWENHYAVGYYEILGYGIPAY